MSTTIGHNNNYHYVFDLAIRLSPEDQERLIRDMDVSRKKHDTNVKETKWVEYTVPGEFISPERMEEIKRIGERRERRRPPEELEENRQKLLEILLNCPVMSEEDLQGIIDARKEINECRLAYL